jgi:hypothetical protein
MKLTFESVDYMKELDRHTEDAFVEYFLRDIIKTSKTSVTTDSEVSKEWLEESTRYLLKTLSVGQRLTLLAYSTTVFYLILDFMRGGDKYKTGLKVTQVAETDPEEWSGHAMKVLSRVPEMKAFEQRMDKTDNPQDYDKVKKEVVEWLRGYALTKTQVINIQKRVDEAYYEKTCVFLHQLRVLDVTTLPQWRNRCLTMSLSEWRKVLVQFVQDMKGIFKAAPPLPVPMKVYRGLTKRPTAMKGYVSTTLLKGAAKNFINKKTKCCVQTIELSKGARVLPLMVLSRYADEFEMLLESTPSKTRKLK